MQSTGVMGSAGHPAGLNFTWYPQPQFLRYVKLGCDSSRKATPTATLSFLFREAVGRGFSGAEL